MKTRYYQARYATEIKEIGRRYPQIKGTVGGYWNISDPNSAYGQLRPWHSPTAPPPVGCLQMTKGAKRTDFVSPGRFSHQGFLLSPKAKAILEQHQLGNHWFFPVDVSHKGDYLQYYILHTNNDYIDDIDWGKSQFAWSDWVTEKQREEIHEITSLEDKEELFYHRNNKDKRKGMYLKPHQLILKSSFDATQDMVAFYRIAMGTLVSERLKQALEENQATGVRFEEVSVFDQWLNME